MIRARFAWLVCVLVAACDRPQPARPQAITVEVVRPPSPNTVEIADRASRSEEAGACVTPPWATVQVAPVEPRTDRENDEDTRAVWSIPVGSSPVLGPKTALVTMVVFSDFECPFCNRVRESIKALFALHPGDLRLVWKNQPLPFHPHAASAAQVALEVRAQKGECAFWAATEAIFDHQKALTDDELLAHVTLLGVHEAGVRSALATKKHQRVIDDDVDLADEVQAEGTPYFFINGRRLVGAEPLDLFEAVIAEELSRARRLVDSGVKREAVYDTIMQSAKGPRLPERRDIPVPRGAPSKGAATAKVVVQVFGDFQDPFSLRASPTVHQLLSEFPSDVRLVWRHLPHPVHPNARLAAQAAIEAQRQKGDAGFWLMHDRLFGAPSDLTRAALERHASALGLDMVRFKRALDTFAHAAAVDADVADATQANLRSPPAFLINGYLLSGAPPYPKFRRLVLRALDEAK